MSVMVGLGFLWYLPIPLIVKFCVSAFYAFFMGCALFTFWYCIGEEIFNLQMSELPASNKSPAFAVVIEAKARPVRGTVFETKVAELNDRTEAERNRVPR
jgi:hypothetical protein